MGKNDKISVKNKLDQLLGLLKSRDFWTTSDLADELSVSTRTLLRYIKDLREAGVPIESDRGRGGGLSLSPYYGLGRIDLNYMEVIDLVLALTTLEKMQSSLFLQDLKSVKNKILRAFPERQKKEVNELRKRIFVGAEASGYVMDSYNKVSKRILNNIHTGFFEKRCLKIKYCNEKMQETVRVIEPEILLLNWPVWYIVGFDHLRGETRNFRLDRVIQCKLLETGFNLRNQVQIQTYIKRFFQSI